MAQYEVFPTRWDDPKIIDGPIPAVDLSFSMPLSDHGVASWSARVEPGKSFWRPTITQYLSGVVIARDGQPVWQGWVIGEEEGPDRQFQFRAVEWGWFFKTCPARVITYAGWNDVAMFVDLVANAQATAGQNVQVNTSGNPAGSSTSDRVILASDDTDTEREFTSVATAEGGPEWYFGSTGTLDQPVRKLLVGDRLGSSDPAAMLEFVDDTGGVGGTHRRGGNVIEKVRTRSADSQTVAVAIGAGDGAAQVRRTATASTLIAQGWPRMTRARQYSDTSIAATLQRHANADLAAGKGFATGYSLTTRDGDPDWTQVPRGSTVQVSLDTDIYAGPRPLEFTTRVLNTTVRVPDSGDAEVKWDVATVQEV